MTKKEKLIEELVNIYEGIQNKILEERKKEKNASGCWNESEFYSYGESIWNLKTNPENYTKEELENTIAKYSK